MPILTQVNSRNFTEDSGIHVNFVLNIFNVAANRSHYFISGNLLACPDGRLCYLDFGMMSYANREQRNGFLLAVVHIVNRDWSELVRVYQNLGFIPEDTDVRPIEVALENALPDVLNAEISELKAQLAKSRPATKRAAKRKTASKPTRSTGKS